MKIAQLQVVSLHEKGVADSDPPLLRTQAKRILHHTQRTNEIT
jgi:hypothetical protein